jgi:hypothetical protein
MEESGFLQLQRVFHETFPSELKFKGLEAAVKDHVPVLKRIAPRGDMGQAHHLAAKRRLAHSLKAD